MADDSSRTIDKPSWLSRNTFSPSDSLHADDMNNLANDLNHWGGDVNGGGHHLSNIIIDPYQPPSGGVASTSPLHIIPSSTDYSSQLRLDSEAGGTPARWIFIKDASQENGSNTGSNFELEACDDSGNVLSTPIAINRASGITTIGQQQWGGNVNGGGFTLTNVVIPSVFADPLTTKGDMVVHGTTTTRLPVGPDGTVIQADSTQPLGVKWSTSPAVPVSTQVIAGAGMSGGGALTGNVTLNALVTSVLGRTGAVVLTSADVSGASGVLNTRQVIAGSGMSGGGPLTTDITLNALVTSVFGRTGAVVLTAADLAGVGVPATRKLIAGSGMSIAGNANSDLSTDLTLTAAVSSVQGHTGAVTLSQSDLGTAGAVIVTQGVLNTDGTLSGGGAFGPTTGANGGNLTLSVVPNKTVQKINFYSNNSASPVMASSGLNLIPGTNMTIQMVPNAGTGNMDVELISNGVMAIWTTNSNVNSGQPVFVAGQPAVNFIAGSNVTISGTSIGPPTNRVELTISAVGGTGGGGSQSPWTGPIYGSGYPLNGASFIGVNASSDANNSTNPARLAVVVGASNETGVRVSLTGTGATTLSSTVQVQNDNGTSRAALISYGSLYGGTLEGTAGLRAAVGPMTFAMGSPETEVMRISSPGNRVLIGTTSDDGIEMLQVAGKIKTIGSPTTSGIVFGDGTVQTTAAVTATGGVPVGPVGAIQTQAGAGAFGGDGSLTYSATTNVLTQSSAVNNPTLKISGTVAHVAEILLSTDGGNRNLLQSTSYSGTNPTLGALNLILYNARGSQASPAALQQYDALFLAQSNGWNGTGWVVGAQIYAQTLENWDVTHNRTDMTFFTASGGTAAAERMRITGTGNVGIGVSPTYKVDISQGSVQTAPLHISYDGSDTGLWMFVGGGANSNGYFAAGSAYISGTWIAKATNQAHVAVRANTGDVSFFADSGLTVGSTFTPTQRMVINSAGNAGIATASPAQALDVNGVITVQDGGIRTVPGGIVTEVNAQLIDFGMNEDSASRFGPYNSARQGGLLRFDCRTTSTPVMTIQVRPAGSTALMSPAIAVLATGNVGIGTVAPNEVLSVITANRTTVATANQIAIGEGSNNIQYRLNLGYINLSPVGWSGSIQALGAGVGVPLLLNPSGGNVGIGTTATPMAALYVNRSFIAYNSNDGGQFPSTANNIGLTIGCNYSSGGGETNFWNMYTGGGSKSFDFRQVTGASTSNVLMTILSNGNVGIGNVGPDALLALQMNVAANSYNNYISLRMYGAVDNAAGRIAGEDYNGNVRSAIDFVQNGGTNFLSQIVFSTNNGGALTERMRISPAGFVGINSAAPSAALTVVNQATAGMVSNVAYFAQGTLAVTAGTELPVVTFAGITTPNATYLSLRARRRSAVNSWSTCDYILSFDVDASIRAGASVTIGGNSCVGIQNISPVYALDVSGDVNCTGTFRVNGTAFASGAPGAWTAYTPTATDAVGANVPLGNVSASYCVSGTVLFIQIHFTYTAGANTGTINFTLPISVVGGSFTAWVNAAGAQNLPLNCTVVNNSIAQMVMYTNAAGAITANIGASLRIS